MLRLGSRFHLRVGSAAWVSEVRGAVPWQRIALRAVDGDLLGPVSWEFAPRGSATQVRHVFDGVQVNGDRLRQAFLSGAGWRRHSDAMQAEAFAGMRRVLESGSDVSGGDLFDALRTLSSVRRFRPDPIPNSVLRHVIEAATHAPSARNAQPWYFLVVREPDAKRAIAALYLAAWRRAQAFTAAANADADIKDRPGYTRMMRAVDQLATHLDSAPALVLACLDTTQLGPMADGAGTVLAPQSAYASIFPAVQNLMLAARGLGLGSTLTTVYAGVEADLKAVVGVPAHVHIAALVPLGYPMGSFRVTTRKPVDAVLFAERWGARLTDE